MDQRTPMPDDDELDAALAAAYALPHAPAVPSPGDERRGLAPEAGAESGTPQGHTNYRIQGEVARGGMGVILKARDSDLGRDVALKVLRADLALRPDVQRRFIEEAQIGGQLQHPGVVPVYELGFMADKRPYFAMKLVEGRTLAALLGGSDALDRRKLLDVFEAVCQTMAYAHSRGVVHRDLKPANILIGAFGEVQVVDWGLAKVLGQGGVGAAPDAAGAAVRERSAVETVRTGPDSLDSHSLDGSVMGTPAYMPPEQARGEVQRLDERSDVFSLGAILCELLTGQPPYTGTPREAVAQAAKGEFATALRRLEQCGADGELVDLCVHCLAADPSARPRSAAVLAEGVHAYLVSVESRAHQSQIREAAARVRAKATALLSATGLALVLSGGGAWMWWRERRAESTRTTERAVASALQDATLARGRQDWAAAIAALERARARLESGEAGAQIREQAAALGTSIESEAESARRAAQLEGENARLLAALQDVRQPEGDKIYPTNWRDLDRRYARIFAAEGLAIDDGALEESTRGLAARGVSVELASALDAWASARRRAQDDAGAARLAALADALDPDPMRRELRAALTGKDLDPLLRMAKSGAAAGFPAPTLRALAHALVEAKYVDDAVSLLTSARRAHPQDFELAVELARALRKTTPPRAQDASSHYEVALALRPDSVETWHELGQTLLNDLQRPAEALDLFRIAVEHVPADGHLQFHVANALTTLGRHAEAVVGYRSAIQLEPDLALAHCDLGISLDILGRTDEAVESYTRAIALDPELALAHYNLGISLAKLSRNEEALASYRRSLELDPALPRAHFNIGYTLAKLRRYDEAIAAYQKAIELDPAFAPSQHFLGFALERVGRIGEAIEAYGRALRIDPKDRYSHRSLAWLLATAEQEGLRDAAGAVEHARRAAELAPQAADDAEVLGIALYGVGSFEAARTEVERAIELGGEQPSRLLFLSMCAARLGDSEQARAEYARVAPELDALASDIPELRRFVVEARALFAKP